MVVDLPLTQDCLVGTWEVAQQGGIGMGVGQICAQVMTQVPVPAMGSVEDSNGFGALGAGNYRGSAYLSTPNNLVLDTNFQVL